MSRSVDYLSHAMRVTYFHVSPDGENDDYVFDDFLSNVTSSLKSAFPSLRDCKRWDGRETRIFLENNLVEIGVSEYCGLASISIRVFLSDYVNENLAENWISKVWDRMKKVMAENTYHQHLEKTGTFSNGEAVFQKA